MDIRQWLENTADREPPDRSDDINIPEQFQHDRPVGDQGGRSYRYKRKRASSDSSIIASEKKRHRKAQAPTRSTPANVDATGDTGAGADGRDSSHRSSPAGARALDKTYYEKRARHKTRPDRYEPKARKPKKPRASRKEQRTERKRRKSHRKDDGGRTTGLVQSFQLKDGPKNSRLTLKPDASVGLFKHGRASVQIAAKGVGLPDLAFNEMRFLQTPIGQPNDTGDAAERPKVTGTNHKTDQAEEISAYFNAKTAVNNKRQERRNNAADRAKVEDPQLGSSQMRQAKEAGHVDSLVELPGKLFLGFGSRGVQPVSNAGHDDGATYYTWSESGKRPSSPPLQHGIDRRANGLERNKSNRYQNGQSRSHGECEPASARSINRKRPADVETKQFEYGTWIRTGRGGDQAIVEVFQPPSPPRGSLRHATPALQTTSQSLPRHPSSPPHFERHDRSNVVQPVQRDRSYHTSDILKVHYAPTVTYDETYHFHSLDNYVDQNKENRNPQSSLSIDKALQQARMAAERSHGMIQLPTQVRDTGLRSPLKARTVPSVGNLPRIRQLSRPYRSGLDSLISKPQRPHPPVNEQWQSPATHRTLSKAEREHWEAAAIETLTAPHLRTIQMERPTNFREDEEMLDNMAESPQTRLLGGEVPADNWYGSGGRYVERFTAHSSLFEAQMSAAGRPPTTSAISSAMVDKSRRVRGLSIEKNLYSESNVVPEADEVDDGLAGFWKPNMLY